MVFPKEKSLYKRIYLKIISEAVIKDFKVKFLKIIKSETLKEDLGKVLRNERFIK